MGHKTHPVGFRLGIIKDWQSRWFAGTSKAYAAGVLEDLRIRETIRKRYTDAGISLVEIERSAQDLTVNVHTARPRIVIGRGGARWGALRKAVAVAARGQRARPPRRASRESSVAASPWPRKRRPSPATAPYPAEIRRCSTVVQRSITTSSPASRARAAASSCTMRSCIHTVRAPASIASSTTSGTN